MCIFCLNFKSEEDRRRERIEDWDRHQEGKGYRTKRFRSPVNNHLFYNVVLFEKRSEISDLISIKLEQQF